MKIKICGLVRKEDIEYVNNSRPDYVGFVFAKSKRQVTCQQAGELKKLLSRDIKAIGVFVDENIDEITYLVENHIIDGVQLHGNENQQYIQELRKKIHCPIIKAIRVKDKPMIFNHYDVDYYLLDSSKPGSGQTFDWQQIKQLDKPFFLAGGINLYNIDEAMKISRFGIDVSSGVESDGKKDPIKIEEIVRRVKDECR